MALQSNLLVDSDNKIKLYCTVSIPYIGIGSWITKISKLVEVELKKVMLRICYLHIKAGKVFFFI